MDWLGWAKTLVNSILGAVVAFLSEFLDPTFVKSWWSWSI
jgi:hypothetical protein